MLATKLQICLLKSSMPSSCKESCLEIIFFINWRFNKAKLDCFNVTKLLCFTGQDRSRRSVLCKINTMTNHQVPLVPIYFNCCVIYAMR